MTNVLMLGAFDSKGSEYAFLRQRLLEQDLQVLSANVGVLGSTDLFPVDISAAQIATAAGVDLQALRDADDRGQALSAMAMAAAVEVRRLYDEGLFAGVIGMGGSGGGSVITAAMRALPIGVPKVCVSTLASGDTSPFVGAKDVVLIPSITDVAGVNRISRRIFTQAAGAVAGMMRAPTPHVENDRPLLAASMFGNTTACVDACRESLEQRGYEVLVFHATGTGGQVMESLIDEGLIDACLDITTTEWADEIGGGILTAGDDRLSAPGRAEIPHLIAPGCIDMVNFGPKDTIPAELLRADRLFYEWNPAVTLMRTNREENRQLGKIFAEKANAALGQVAFLLPLKGVSILDGDGQLFCDREADQAFFDSLREHLDEEIPVVEIEANINDPEFSQMATEMMLAMMEADSLP